MPWFAYVIIAMTALSSGVVIANIGRPRDPITPGVALATLVVNGLFIWAIIALAHGA